MGIICGRTAGTSECLRRKIDAVIIIPARFSADVLRGHVPELGLVIDNSDSFLSQTLTTEADDLVKALNQPDIKPRIESKVSLNVIELYPYIEYMKYLLPGSMALAMFVSVMVGVEFSMLMTKIREYMKGIL